MIARADKSSKKVNFNALPGFCPNDNIFKLAVISASASERGFYEDFKTGLEIVVASKLSKIEAYKVRPILQ